MERIIKDFSFENLYKGIEKLWYKDPVDVLQDPIPKEIKAMKIKNSKVLLNGESFLTEFKEFNLLIIKNTNPETVHPTIDSIIYKGKRTILIIINLAYLEKGDDIDYFIAQIYEVLLHIIKYTKAIYDIGPGSIRGAFQYASMIFGFNIMKDYYPKEFIDKFIKEYIDEGMLKNSKDFIKGLYDFSVKELLDDYDIFPLLANKYINIKEYNEAENGIVY